MADDRDGEVPVASLPVYLSASLPSSSHVELFQYPLYARGRPLPVPPTAAQRNQRVTTRWRPQANRVEMDIPLDMRENVYNRDRGRELAENCTSMPPINVPGADAVKQERTNDMPVANNVFDRMRLESTTVQPATRYMVGLVHQGEVHLVPLDAIVQMRPSMQHVDLMSQADEQHHRTSGDDEDTAAATPSAPTQKGASVVSLNVSMRTEPTKASGATSRYGGMAGAAVNQRDAEAERWVPLQFSHDAHTEATHALLAQHRDPLVCSTAPRDFL